MIKTRRFFKKSDKNSYFFEKCVSEFKKSDSSNTVVFKKFGKNS